MTIKTFILDTNVLLSDSNSLFGFGDNNLVLPLIVLEELDRHKDRQDEVGRNAREVVRNIAELTREHKDFKSGIPLGKSPLGEDLGVLRVLGVDDVAPVSQVHLPSELESKKSGDNTIVHFCLNYCNSHKHEIVSLVTRDTILRLKSQALGINCEDYRKFNVATSSSAIYSGVVTLTRPDISVDEFYQSPEEFRLPENVTATLCPHQFVVLKNGQQSVRMRFVAPGKPLLPVKEIKTKLTPRNQEQEFARDLLFDQSVKLVTLSGKAGVGKTLCAIDAGLEQVLSMKRYQTLVVCRPVMPVGRDIGFLPGDLSEKLEPWLAPIKDNLRFLLGLSSDGNTKKRSKQYDEKVLTSYFEDGTIEVQALSYIRGRSIANAFIIIDEAQNTNLHEIRTILTRVGENTKIVVTGDPEQIDATHVDAVSNGLSIAIERFKGHKIAGHVTFKKGERSNLATVASEILS